jgi:GT2 family glycosyltransferase
LNIHIVFIGYALDLRPLVDAVEGPDTYFHIYTHSQRPEAQAIKWWSKLNVTLHDYGTNRGLSTSWNDGVIEAQADGADAILVINDDVSMTRDDILQMARGCVNHREAGIIVAQGYNERMVEHQILQFACFGINPIAIEKVGYFDENFYPIYFEDTDYSRRCALLGVAFHDVGYTNAVHKGSTSVNTVPTLSSQNQVTFPACHHYYRLKHGGSPGSETFKYPFGDPQLNWKIEAEARHNPYPTHDRQDKDVVKL